ncbi:hypothetical protein OO012_06610 [Rhodobacteraceae bacterium KMM 6894]|nr:hypothetical protein [Rhodobacteraceae bacterium KMM 6894]
MKTTLATISFAVLFATGGYADEYTYDENVLINYSMYTEIGDWCGFGIDASNFPAYAIIYAQALDNVDSAKLRELGEKGRDNALNLAFEFSGYKYFCQSMTAESLNEAFGFEIFQGVGVTHNLTSN